MGKGKFIWKNGKLVAWDDAKIHVLTHGLHYGSAVFEGIRCYKNKNNQAVVFKLEEHIARLFYSAEQLDMKIPYSVAEICQAVTLTLASNNCVEGYIRPLVYYGYGDMKVAPAPDLPVDIIVSCWPWKDYLPVAAVDVFTSPYIRIHPKSTVADAKISGHYVNSLLSGLAIKNTKYHESLMLDSEGFVAEGSAENIFLVKNGKLITPPTGTILVGITRNTIFQIADKLGIEVEERYFKPEEVYTADEAFFCGTAVEIAAIRSLDDKIISDGNIGNITDKIKKVYQQVVHGELPEFETSLTKVINKEL